MDSYLGTATDSFNYILILKKLEDGKYQSYQVCVENGKDKEERDLYLSEYDLFTDDVGKTSKIDEVFKDDDEVVVISDVEEV